MYKIVSYLPLYGFLAYCINLFFAYILNCVCMRIIQLSFLIYNRKNFYFIVINQIVNYIFASAK